MDYKSILLGLKSLPDAGTSLDALSSSIGLGIRAFRFCLMWDFTLLALKLISSPSPVRAPCWVVSSSLLCCPEVEEGDGSAPLAAWLSGGLEAWVMALCLILGTWHLSSSPEEEGFLLRCIALSWGRSDKVPLSVFCRACFLAVT